jgi:hypothetical protein
MLTSADLLDLDLGVRDPIIVCHFDHVLANILSAQTPIVYLSRYTLDHIRKRHSDLTDDELLFLPEAIARGLITKENMRPRHVTVCYQQPLGRRYIAALKLTGIKHAFYIDTFHRAREKQTTAMLSRGRILRTHK